MKGLFLYEYFISESRAANIVEFLESMFPESPPPYRSIQRFGLKISYSGDFISKEIPQFLIELCKDIVDAGYLKDMPGHITINKYFPGGYIQFHVDSAAAGEVITILSLCSDGTMVFRNPKTKEKINILLPKNSLTQLKDEARYFYEHSIPRVKETRYSIVFRDK